MENWEFLLQKEGDGAWHPIKAQNVAIREGKYRVVAHTHHPNTEIEIRVAYQTLGEEPPKRRAQKRSRNTNEEGLMVVIPSTYLKPGLWELSCASDITNDVSPDHWQPWIQLKVLPTVTKTILNPSNSEAGTKEKSQSTNSVNSEAGNPVKISSDNPILQESLESLEEVLHQVFDPFLDELNDPEFLPEMRKPLRQEIAPPPHTGLRLGIPSATSSSDRQQQLLLTLKQNNFIAHGGSRITLSGELKSTQTSQKVVQGYLRIKLRHPQNSQILLEKSQPLRQQVLPLAFSCNLEVPSDQQTHLLLGEVTLYNSAEVALESQPFSIAVDLEELLGKVLRTHSDRVEAIVKDTVTPSPPATDRESVPLHTAFEEISATSNPIQPLQPAPNRPLPPQIHKPVAKPTKSLELPKLPNSRPPAITPTQTFSEVEPEPSVQESVEDAIDTETPLEPEKPIVVDNAFQSLKLEDRFWSRLNTLAMDGELSEWLEVELLPLEISIPPEEEIAVTDVETVTENIDVDREQIPEKWEQETTDSEHEGMSEELEEAFNFDFIFPDEVEIPTQQKTETIVNKTEPQPEATAFLVEMEEVFTEPDTSPEKAEEESLEEIDWSEREIVVDDDLSTPDGRGSKLQSLPSLLSLEDQLLPTPELVIPSGELIAGKTITIQVTLPATSVLLYVKLWIQDRQTRYILEAPRNLLDFSLNNSGTFETSVELTVPVGSLEIRFEAIAIDSVTQRESHKVSVDRFVVSPEDNDFSLEDFE